MAQFYAHIGTKNFEDEGSDEPSDNEACKSCQQDPKGDCAFTSAEERKGGEAEAKNKKCEHHHEGTKCRSGKANFECLPAALTSFTHTLSSRLFLEFLKTHFVYLRFVRL